MIKQLLAILFVVSTSCYAGRDQFVGTWVNRNPASSYQRIVVSSGFVVSMTSLDDGDLVTYGSDIGHPYSHRVATAVFESEEIITSALFILGGGILGSANDMNVLDIYLFFDKGNALNYGNTATHFRFDRVELPSLDLIDELFRMP